MARTRSETRSNCELISMHKSDYVYAGENTRLWCGCHYSVLLLQLGGLIKSQQPKTQLKPGELRHFEVVSARPRNMRWEKQQATRQVTTSLPTLEPTRFFCRPSETWSESAQRIRIRIRMKSKVLPTPRLSQTQTQAQTQRQSIWKG